MLQKVSVYPVLFPSGLMRKKRLFYLGLSRYIPAAGQTEPKQIAKAKEMKLVSLSGSLGYAALISKEHFLPSRGPNHRPILPCLAAASKL